MAPVSLTSDEWTVDEVRAMQDLIKTDISIVVPGPFQITADPIDGGS